MPSGMTRLWQTRHQTVWGGVLALALFLGGCVGPHHYQPGAYADYVAGQYARAEGDEDKAAEHYRRALQIDPTNTAILGDAFGAALMGGDFVRGLDYARTIYATSELRATASMFLALDAFKRKKYAQSLTYLDSAEGSGFDSLIAPVLIAWAAAAEGDKDAALAALEGFARTPIFRPYARDNRAMLLDYLGEYEQAELVYQQTLADVASLSVHPVLAYASMMERRGRLDEARSLLSAYKLRWPENRRVGAALENMDKHGRSKLMAPKPATAVGLSLLRAAAEIAGDNALAPATLYARFATFIAPDRHDAFLLIGNLLIAQNNPKAGLKALAQIDRRSMFSDLARIREAFAYNSLGETDRALGILGEYIARNPNDLGTRTSLGDLYQVNEDWERALEQYDAILAQIGTPTSENWYQVFSRAICYERLGRWGEAEADFLLAMELRPDEAQVMNYLGYSWIDRGKNIEEAQKLIERAVELRPNDGAIVDSLGWVLYLTGDYERAVEFLEQAVNLVPTDPLVSDHLGDAYWMVGRKMEARFQWSRSLTLDPEERFRTTLEAKIKLGLEIAQAINQAAAQTVQDN